MLQLTDTFPVVTVNHAEGHLHKYVNTASNRECWIYSSTKINHPIIEMRVLITLLKGDYISTELGPFNDKVLRKNNGTEVKPGIHKVSQIWYMHPREVTLLGDIIEMVGSPTVNDTNPAFLPDGAVYLQENLWRYNSYFVAKSGDKWVCVTYIKPIAEALATGLLVKGNLNKDEVKSFSRAGAWEQRIRTFLSSGRRV